MTSLKQIFDPILRFWHYLDVREIRIINTKNGKVLNKNNNQFSISGVELDTRTDRTVSTVGACKGVSHPTEWFKEISTKTHDGKEKVSTHFVLLENGIDKAIIITRPEA